MPRKVLPIRNQVIAMLAQPGITHADIAKALSCSVKTVSRISTQVKADINEADSKLATLSKEITAVISVKDRAKRYATLAKSAKNEAVSLGALQRIDDLDGIVTEKERMRAKRDEQPANQPMFVLPQGAMINVTVNQQNNTISSSSLPDNSAIEVNPLKTNE